MNPNQNPIPDGTPVTVQTELGTETGNVAGSSNPAAGEQRTYTIQFADDTRTTFPASAVTDGTLRLVEALADLAGSLGEEYHEDVIVARRWIAAQTPTAFRVTSAPPVEFVMDDVVKALAARQIPAYVEMTGGGVATIYVGKMSDERFPVIAGPGSFTPGHSTASTADFYIGPDDDGADFEAAVSANGMTVEGIVDEIADQYGLRATS